MINLLPPEVKESYKFAKYNVVLARYVFVAVLAIIVMASLMFYGKASLASQADVAETALANDRAEIADLQKVNTEAEELSGTIDTIATILDQEVRFSLLLQEIGSVMPNGAILSAISLSQDTTEPIRMSVSLTSAETAGVLQQNLIESRLFLSADIINVNKSGAQNDEYGFAGDIVAYYDPSFNLATLDDPVPSEEDSQLNTSTDTPATEAPSEPVSTPEPQQTPEASTSAPIQPDENEETAL